MKVWIEGEIVEGAQARIPVTDHGLLYGDGIFEGLRVYAGAIFRLPDHLRRLGAAARALGIEIPGGLAGVEEILLATARAYGRPDAYIRLLVTRGDGALGVDPTLCESPRIVCIVDEVRLYTDSKQRSGIDLVTASQRRPSPDVLDPRIKSLNYLNSVLAKREARLRGADEALLLNAAGCVAEASVANVFCVRRGVLRTPPVTDGALEGITRASLLEIAEAMKLPYRVETLGRFDLFDSEEVFLSGTGARIVPVATLDGQAIGSAGGRPVTERLSDAFSDFTKDHGTPL